MDTMATVVYTLIGELVLLMLFMAVFNVGITVKVFKRHDDDFLS